jgi:hypothetical protein
MSIVAMNWAMKQRTDSPSAQIVLFTIADRADEHGVCRHADPDTIAEITRQSRATIFRRLEELERAGTLSRFTRHLDDGRRKYEIRLQTTVFVNYRVNKERDIVHLDDDGQTISTVPFGGEPQDADAGSQSETHPQSQIATQPVAPVRPDESQSCDPHKTPSKSPEDSPKPPKMGALNEQSGNVPEEENWPHAESWVRLEAAWGDPILHQQLCRGIWQTFTDAERQRFLRVIRGYLAWRLQQRTVPNRCNLQKLMREIDAWPGYEKLAGPDPTLRTFYLESSEEHRALDVIAAVLGILGPEIKFDDHHGVRGFWRAKPLRPDQVAMVLFADKPKEQWTKIEASTPPFYAWADRYFEWFGKRYSDFRVPCLFPPRKDGSFPQPKEDTTGPPGEDAA